VVQENLAHLRRYLKTLFTRPETATARSH
jgi:hypothetical protein